MNFLSHFHFYRNGDPYFNTGLVLPDLVKAFCRNRLIPGKEFSRPQLNALDQGSRIHLESDIKFHNSAYFEITTGFISTRLDGESKWPRKWFLNHLLGEILLDRVLMDENGDLCHDFYAQLESTDPDQIVLFLKLSGIPNPQNFTEGLIRFLSIKFISEYAHNEKIILALQRVYRRLGISYEWTDYDKDLLMRHIPDILEFTAQRKGLLAGELQ